VAFTEAPLLGGSKRTLGARDLPRRAASGRKNISSARHHEHAANINPTLRGGAESPPWTRAFLGNGPGGVRQGESSKRGRVDGFRSIRGEKRPSGRKRPGTALLHDRDPPTPGLEGKYISMPPPKRIPKAGDRSRTSAVDGLHRPNTRAPTAELGMGALGFSFVSPADMATGRHVPRSVRTLVCR